MSSILSLITLSLRERAKIKDFVDTNIPSKIGIGIKYSVLSPFKKLCYISIGLAAVNSFNSALASDTASSEVPTIVVKKDQKTGKYEVPTDFPGSASYISPQTVEERQTKDIDRLVRTIPGINITEEDGYGLRPNIGMRGSRNDRSANITLMEDGILTSPAPYAASSAYYFPSMGRVKGLEVRKGASSIKYGPRTTSGVLNLITTPIPSFSKGALNASIGSYEEKSVNFNYGDSFKNFSYVVNFDQQSSDGFKKLDGGGDTGYNLQDYMLKMRLHTDKNAEIYQHLELKLAANDETSNETYMGLSLEDFVNGNPYRRYRASALDEMNAQHRQYQLTHYIEPSKTFNLTTTAYYNEFARNWYKVSKVDGTDIGDILNDTTTYANAFSIMKAETSGSVDVKANNRDYASYGVQSNAKTEIDLAKTKHKLDYGLRYHVDYEDRLQHTDQYTLDSSGNFTLTSAGAVGSSDSDNRKGIARTVSAYLEDEVDFGKFTVIPGVRFEHIELKRENRVSGDNKRNDEDAFIPGIAASYKLGNNAAVFAGVHKGFAPPSPGSAASIEESVNYELGSRYRGKNNLFLESVLFFNDYDNLLGTDTNSGGGAGSGEQYNGGKVQAYGLELAAGYDIKTDIAGQAFKFPLAASYTYNNAEFKSSFTENGIEEWGDVSSGDQLPYIAQHQFALTAGLEVNKFSLFMSNKFVSEMRATAGQGAIAKSDKIPAHFITDVTSFYEFKKGQKFFLAVDNIFDREYVASLRPAGLRPGKPMTARIGMKIDF